MRSSRWGIRPPQATRNGRARATSRSARCSSREVSSSRARRRIRASSDSCRSTTCWRRDTRDPSSPPTWPVRRCSASGRSATSPICPTTPSRLCAQIVAPYPPLGRIGVASQSGNLVSSFMNLARATGVGISRAVSAGNAAAVSVADYLEFYAHDPATAVALAYVATVRDGAALMARLGDVAARKPLVLLKGGATPGGARAAPSHTGALAADDKLFDGACRAYGITRAAGVEEAFEAAATFATQPLPKGPRVVVLTTAGGWGVVTADAITRSSLELLPLPDDLRAALDEKLPPRWSGGNPVDLAGGETRDTIPEVLDLIAGHDGVDAIVYLGPGIQSNQARLMREGPFWPGSGL